MVEASITRIASKTRVSTYGRGKQHRRYWDLCLYVCVVAMQWYDAVGICNARAHLYNIIVCLLSYNWLLLSMQLLCGSGYTYDVA